MKKYAASAARAQFLITCHVPGMHHPPVPVGPKSLTTRRPTKKFSPIRRARSAPSQNASPVGPADETVICLMRFLKVDTMGLNRSMNLSYARFVVLPAGVALAGGCA
jgi:hypothetical protein